MIQQIDHKKYHFFYIFENFKPNQPIMIFKKVFFSMLAFGMIINFSVAQIETEIKSFVDSTETLMNQGRKLMIQSLNENNLAKIREIYFYLEKEAGNTNTSAFSYTDDLYLNLLMNNWSIWFDKAKNIREFANQNAYPNQFPISEILYNNIMNKKEKIIKLINESNTSEEEKDLLKIYLHFLSKDHPDVDYNENVRSFKQKYSFSQYTDFLDFYLPKVGTKFSFSYNIGGGFISPTEKLKQNFSSGGIFTMGMDINVGKVYTSLYFGGGSMNLTQPFSATTEIETLNFTKNESFSYFEGGFLAGYFIVRDRNIHLAPYFSISGSTLESSRYTNDDDGKDVFIFDGFTYGPGLHTEFKLKDYSAQTPYQAYLYGSSGYFSIKIDAGININNNAAHEEFEGNIIYVRAGIVWGLGEF